MLSHLTKKVDALKEEIKRKKELAEMGEGEDHEKKCANGAPKGEDKGESVEEKADDKQKVIGEEKEPEKATDDAEKGPEIEQKMVEKKTIAGLTNKLVSMEDNFKEMKSKQTNFGKDESWAFMKGIAGK